MAKKQERYRVEDGPPAKGLKRLLGGLFSSKKTADSEEDDDFRPATRLPSLNGGPAHRPGAQAPSRADFTAAAAKRAPDPSPSGGRYAPSPRENPENRVAMRGSKLYELYCRMSETPVPQKSSASYSLSLMMYGEAAPDAEQRGWLKGIDRDVRSMPQYVLPKVDPRLAEAPLPLPVDAYAFVRVAADGMAAYLFLLPPLAGGQPLPSEWVYRLLREQQVNTGIDDASIEAACQNGTYLQLMRVAGGILPIPGEDGEVEDFFSREIAVQLTVQDDDTIDFKDLGWLQTVREGEVLCDLLLPTTGTPGVTVRGRAVPAPAGRHAVPPSGPGTHLRDDGTALLASLDGVLTFVGGSFRVDPLLIVKADVDNAIGNLDVVGDILIYGDIREGFSVTASGSITVQGMVEGACVKAGGDIRISLGLNGNQTGHVQAGGNLMARFIENAHVDTEGMIVCESIINSTVRSNTSIKATAGRGAIVGGNVRALDFVEATTLGNESNRMLMITLGTTTTLLQEMEALEEKYEALAADIADKEKNILYLTALEEALHYKEAAQLDDLRQGTRVQKMQLANLRRRIAVLARKQQDYSHCFLKAKVIYPPLQLVIGDMAAELRQTLHNATVHREENEILVEEAPAPKNRE